MSSVSRQSYFVLYNMYILTSLSCLIALTTAAGIILNKNSKGGYHYLIPNLRKKAWNLCPLNTMLAVVIFVDGLSQVEEFLF